jgi:hypothetical protein
MLSIQDCVLNGRKFSSLQGMKIRVLSEEDGGLICQTIPQNFPLLISKVFGKVFGREIVVSLGSVLCLFAAFLNLNCLYQYMFFFFAFVPL